MLKILLLLLPVFHCYSQKTVTFEIVDLPKSNFDQVGIRGNTLPLSWDKTIFLDKTERGYLKEIYFDKNVENIEYKFVIDTGNAIVWEKIANRSEILSKNFNTFSSVWNQEKLIDPKALPRLTVKQLQEDFEVLQNALIKVHPGLYRYNDSVAISQNLQILKSTFQEPLTYAETFIALSKFISTIQCDHTLVSFFNQEPIINSIIHRQKDKMPFTFNWFDNRMIIDKGVDSIAKIEKGSEILSINGVPVQDILRTLIPHISADGATTHNKISKASIDGYSFRYSAFDVLYPLLFPLKSDQIELRIKRPKEKGYLNLIVEALTREERNKRLIAINDDFPKSPEDLWEYKILEYNIGYLKIGSFATNRFDIDWKFFLRNAFSNLRRKNISNLILDIRENQGGMDEAAYELEQYIIKNEFVTNGFKMQSRFILFPNDIKAHIETWDNWFYDLRGDEHIKDKDYFIFPGLLPSREIKSSENTFTGHIYMLTGSRNVSGAFYLARLFKQSKSGLLVGQETGGNEKGINGGAILFLKPPNSRININLPVMGTFATTKKPNRGILPDILIERKDIDQNNDIDLELSETVMLIKANR